MFANLTPHKIVILNKNGGQVTEVQPSGTIARVAMERIEVGQLEPGCPVCIQVPGEVTGLPAPQRDIAYIVSALVRLAVPDRIDVFSPGELVRDESGQPIGCLGLDANTSIQDAESGEVAPMPWMGAVRGEPGYTTALPYGGADFDD